MIRLYRFSIFIALTSLFACSLHRPKNEKEEILLHDSCHPDNASETKLDESQYVAIGGVQQWVTINGDDCSNPVLIMVHGGPGKPFSLYHDSLFKGFEEHFTVVHWDQRGSGRTYQAQFTNDQITLENITNQNVNTKILVEDGLDLSDYIRRRLGKEKVIISGASWGSYLALTMVHSAPSKYYFYVGLSQLVNGEKNYSESYKKVKEIAFIKGDNRSSAILEEIGPPSWSNPTSFGKLRRIISKYESDVATSPVPWEVSDEYKYDLLEPTHVFSEEFSFLRYTGFNNDGMLREVSLDECCTRFEIPIYLIQGEQDLVTVPKVTDYYFNKIVAPDKELKVVQTSGHDPNQEMLEVYIHMLNYGSDRHIN